MFDSATAILYVLDSSTFDVNVRDDFESNRLLEATEVFEHIWNCRFLKDVSILLFINKIDLLVEKIMSGSGSIENFLKTIPTSHKYYPLYEKVYKSFGNVTGNKLIFIYSLSLSLSLCFFPFSFSYSIPSCSFFVFLNKKIMRKNILWNVYHHVELQRQQLSQKRGKNNKFNKKFQKM